MQHYYDDRTDVNDPFQHNNGDYADDVDVDADNCDSNDDWEAINDDDQESLRPSKLKFINRLRIIRLESSATTAS